MLTKPQFRVVLEAMGFEQRYIGIGIETWTNPKNHFEQIWLALEPINHYYKGCNTKWDEGNKSHWYEGAEKSSVVNFAEFYSFLITHHDNAVKHKQQYAGRVCPP